MSRKYGIAVAVAVLAVACAGALYALFGFGSLAGLALPSGLAPVQRTPDLGAALSSPANGTPEGMLSVIAGGLHATDMLNVTYSGSVNLTLPEATLGVSQLEMPLQVDYARYMGSSKLYVNMEVTELMLNATFIGMALQGGASYACSRFTLISNGSGNGFDCVTGGATAGGQAPPGLENGTLDVVGERTYMRENCTLVSLDGVLNSTALNGTVYGIVASNFLPAGNGTYSYYATACLSDRYYVPLNLTATIVPDAPGNATGGTVLELHETSISDVSSKAYVEAMPSSSTVETNTTVAANTTTNYT